VSAARQTKSARETFAELYEEFMPKVYRFVRYRVSDTQVTEDLTSGIFEKALVNFERYSSDKASFSTWIFTIARNTVIDHYRTRGRRGMTSLEESEIEVASKEPTPVETLERQDEKARLRGYLSELSSEEQEIISMKFGAEQNNRQIASALGLSESNVGTKLYRAVRKLRDSFREPEDG
jgi:RNA polymerase sigma-70 factor (ECF subfamily)